MKSLGNLNNGVHNIGMPAGPFKVTDAKQGLAINYEIVNYGHGQWQKVDDLITRAGQEAASAGAKAIMTAGGAYVGLVVGNAFVPILGGAVGFALSLAADEGAKLITADCDGWVAGAQIQLSGQDLWRLTSGPDGRYTGYFFHPGKDSPHGCGSNSQYWTTYTIVRS